MKLKKHRIIFDGKYYRCQERKLWALRWKYIGGLFHPLERRYSTLTPQEVILKGISAYLLNV